jgi:L-rhamnose-H+ transport protein
MIIGVLLVPGLAHILHQAPSRSIELAYFWGAMWGIGGLAFGLAIRYLGQSLGYAIALGLTAAFGTLMPPLFSGQLGGIARERSGQVILLGVAVCLAGIVLTGLAGTQKDKELSKEQKKETIKEFNLRKGMPVAIFAGVMSACFAYGLAAGQPIAGLTKTYLVNTGREDLWENLPVLVVVLLGGFTTNFIWSVTQILRNRTLSEYAGIPSEMQAAVTSVGAAAAGPARLDLKTLAANYMLSLATGLLWYFQFFFYSMGQARMGKYDFSSWTLHMASIIFFSTLWGVMLNEWRDSSTRTRTLVALGLAVLITSTVIVGYGNYLKMAPMLR